MPFNGPIDGDYTNVDYNKGPWVNEIMTLTHDECLQVQAGFQTVIDNYKPEEHYGDPLSEMVLHSEYNKLDWQYAISLNTFTTLRVYDPEVNTLGTNEFGIIYPEPEPEPEPVEETPVEEEIVVEDATPNIYETLFGEEQTTEEPAE